VIFIASFKREYIHNNQLTNCLDLTLLNDACYRSNIREFGCCRIAEKFNRSPLGHHKFLGFHLQAHKNVLPGICPLLNRKLAPLTGIPIIGNGYYAQHQRINPIGDDNSAHMWDLSPHTYNSTLHKENSTREEPRTQKTWDSTPKSDTNIQQSQICPARW